MRGGVRIKIYDDFDKVVNDFKDEDIVKLKKNVLGSLDKFK